MKVSNNKSDNNSKKSKKRVKSESDETSPPKKKIKASDYNIMDDLNALEEEDIKEINVDDNLDKKVDSLNSDSDDTKNNVSYESKNTIMQKVLKSRGNKLKKKIQKNSLEVSKKRVCHVIDLLQQTKRKRDIYKKSCKFQLKPLSNGKEYGWDSFVHLLKHIQHCILNQEWHNFPDLILLLLRHPGQAMKLFKNFIKEMSYLNFLVHSGTGHADLLDQFYQQMFITISKKKMKNLEVWYRDE